MPKNAKAEARREQQFYAREQRILCRVCGKHFIVRRKGWACSKKCQQQLQATEVLEGQ